MKTPRQKKIKNLQLNRVTFATHLQELRARLTWCVVSFLIASIVGYIFHAQILDVLVRPLNQPIFYTSPAGGFDFVFKISLFFGFILSLPVITYQIIRFIEPALPKKFPRLLFSVLTTSSALLILGISFAYFVSLPAALFFLNKFATGEVKSLISTTEYFNFITSYLIGFGLVFQLPLVMFAINSIHKVPMSKLLKLERWVIVTSFVIAAILTPTPDIINQLIMALPLILLYQITIILLWLVNRRK